MYCNAMSGDVMYVMQCNEPTMAQRMRYAAGAPRHTTEKTGMGGIHEGGGIPEG